MVTSVSAQQTVAVVVFSWSLTTTDLSYTQYNTNTGPAYGVMYIPYRGTLTEPRHDVANKRITANVTAVTAETDLPDPTVSFDQLKYTSLSKVESVVGPNQNNIQ